MRDTFKILNEGEYGSLKKRNSLAVLVVYASDGILDGYIVYLAEKMKESVKTLIITVNGNMNDDGLERLSFYSDSVFVRR